MNDVNQQLTPTNSPLASASAPSLPTTPIPQGVVDFPPDTPSMVCSANECEAGHRWAPVIRVAECPGCKAPILAVKMVNCPVCNEPVKKMTLRSDHLPHGGNISALCQGHATLNEVISIDVERSHAQQEEENYKERDVFSKI